MEDKNKGALGLRINSPVERVPVRRLIGQPEHLYPGIYAYAAGSRAAAAAFAAVSG